MTTSNEISAWFGGRLPAEWVEHGEPSITVDRDEVTVVLTIAEPDLDDDADDSVRSEALAGRVAGWRDETKQQRIRIAREAERRFDQKVAWGAPTFRVNNKLFVHYRNNHHGDGRIAAWCKSLPDRQMDLVEVDSELFFIPPYVGPSGWVGVRLDRTPDWSTVSDLVEQAYRLVAPKRLLRELDQG